MNRGREVLVGAVIVVGIAVTVIGTLWLKGSNFGRPSVRIDVLVEEIGQLAEGNQVRVRGVPVGRVIGFEVEPGGQAVRVLLSLDHMPDLPDDVRGLMEEMHKAMLHSLKDGEHDGLIRERLGETCFEESGSDTASTMRQEPPAEAPPEATTSKERIAKAFGDSSVCAERSQ